LDRVAASIELIAAGTADVLRTAGGVETPPPSAGTPAPGGGDDPMRRRAMGGALGAGFGALVGWCVGRVGTGALIGGGAGVALTW
jgi:hypothetical protein